MLDVLHSWCQRWQVLINSNKSKCVHFRQVRSPCCNFDSKVGDNLLETVGQYKYLGVIFNEENSFSTNCETLAKGTGRALGSVISKVHNLKDIG